MSTPPRHKRGTACIAQPTVASPEHAPRLYSAQSVLRGEGYAELTAQESALFAATAAWLDASISRPHPELGRSGDVCPWTRRTLQLGRMFLASIPSAEPARVDRSLLGLLPAFAALATSDALATFRAIVAVFPRVSGRAGASFVVAAHQRLKPVFLRHRMMLGEFYPGCPKPGLHNPSFRPLHAPHPLLVMRAMVEADLLFLTDQDRFVAAYLDAFGERGRQNLRQLLCASGTGLAGPRLCSLRRQAGMG